MFEIKHLKTLVALEQMGNISKAAEILFSSKSALSHQLKDLERRVGVTVFIRNTNPIEFTPQGKLLLALAEEVLPQIEKTQKQLKIGNNFPQTFKISMSCHACFQWLIPVIEQLKSKFPALDIEFSDALFEKENVVQKKKPLADIMFTDEIETDEDNTYIYQLIGKFEIVAVLPKQHTLVNNVFLVPKDFSSQTLLTYPLPPKELDIFTLFLNQSKNTNKQNQKIKQVENSHMMLQMVAANMGIATLPEWLVNSAAMQSLVCSKSLGEAGIYKTLYAKYPNDSEFAQVIDYLLPKAKTVFSQLV